MMTSAALLEIDSCPIEGSSYDKVNAILDECGIINQEKEGIATIMSLDYRLRDSQHQRQRKQRDKVISTFN